MIRIAAVLAAATVATAFLVNPVQAEEVAPAAARSVTLGAVSGVVYYTVWPDGDHLVATLSVQGGETPMRVEATLGDGQSMLLSVPGPVGERATEIRFVRQGDRVFCLEGALKIGLARTLRHAGADHG